MRLPNAALAVVEREKIQDYLLNPAHPDNGGKAQFFENLGFRRTQWQILATAFRTLALETHVVQSIKSLHGEKYVIVGIIEAPSGTSRKVKTIWIVDRGEDVARLVTAYPQEG